MLTASKARRYWQAIAVVALGLARAPDVSAQVTLDGTLGPAQTLSGPNYTIDSTVGALRGTNLFHSFGAFNVRTGESATFTNSTPVPISNVFARVTGGQVSVVDGLLRSTIAGADLYLLNPQGVMFGPNAALDVPGAFHVSTADYLRLADGGMFRADPQQPSVLTSAPAIAFGFLGPTVAAVSFDRATVEVKDGQTFSVIAGDISVSAATLRAAGGRLQIASVGSAGEVVTTPGLPLNSFSRLGEIHLSQGANATVSSAAGAGTVVIRGGKLVVDSSASINANSNGAGDGAAVGIDIQVNEATFTDGAEMLAFANGTGRAGDMDVSADKLQVANGAFLNSATSSALARNINIKVDTLEIADGGEITAQTRGTADGGNLNVSAREINMSGVDAAFNTGLFGGQFGGAGATGRSANVIVSAESISLTGSANPNLVTGVFGATFASGPGGAIQVNTTTLDMGSNTGLQNTTFGPGAGGTVAVKATELSIAGSSNPNIFTGLFANTFGSGRGGSIQVVAERIKLVNRAAVAAAGFSTGDAGTVAVAAGSLEMSSGSQIYTNVLFGSGNAGSLTVSADSLIITGFRDSPSPFVSTLDFTGLSSSTGTFGKRGGDMSVSAGTLVLTDKAAIFSSSSGAGAAGNIHIDADTLRVSSRSAISTNAFGSGPGGNIDIAAGTVTVEGAGTPLGPNDSIVSAIASQASTGGGAAGQVTIDAGRIEVLDGAKISTQTFGAGNGGNLRITGDTVLVSGINAELLAYEHGIAGGNVDSARSAILASSDRSFAGDAATGNAGKVWIDATELALAAGGSISSTTSTPGLGGKIELAVDTMRLSGGALISAASSTSANAGKAGDVSISAGGSVVIAGSSITTAADRAAGGSIVIQGNDVRFLDGALVSAKSSGAGDAGNIRVTAAGSLQLTDSVISTQALLADGGNIQLIAPLTVQLARAKVSTSVESGAGGGGNILIDPQFVIVKESSITANAFGGPGGNITIIAEKYVADAASVVEASSVLSAPGSVDIHSPENNLAANIAQLPGALLDASRLLRPGCSGRRSAASNSFTVAGRGGVPVDADGYLPSYIAQSGREAELSMIALDCRYGVRSPGDSSPD